MGNKLYKVVISAVFVGLAAVVVAPSAEANRGVPTTTTTTEPSYVPPPKYGQNPHPEVGPEVDPYAPVDTPTTVPMDLGGVPTAAADPGANLAGDGNRIEPVQGGAPTEESSVLSAETTRPTVAPTRGGVFANTGANTMPLVRAGLAALALGAGLILLGRRRRAGYAASA
jgi:hypothetical protein